jgi:hypothetical protein
MVWETAPSRRPDDVALVRAFLANGLAGWRSPDRMISAALATGRPLPFWPNARPRWPDSAILGSLEAELPSVDRFSRSPIRGLRLVVPLRSRIDPHSIVHDAAYPAAARTRSTNTGLASIVLETSRVRGPLVAPALSWPLRVVTPPELAYVLGVAHAFKRELATMEPHAGAAPEVLVEIVEIAGLASATQALVLRFLHPRQIWTRLWPPLRFEELAQAAPCVVFPLAGQSPADILNGFIYELSHNLPVDVAAWEAVRNWQPSPPPLVFAPRAFLRSARLADLIPGLRARLQQLSTVVTLPNGTVIRGPELPVDPETLRKFGPAADDVIRDQTQITVELLDELLSRSAEFPWDHESQSGEGFAAANNATEAIEAAPSININLDWRPSETYADYPEPLPAPYSVPDGAPSQPTAPPPPIFFPHQDLPQAGQAPEPSFPAGDDIFKSVIIGRAPAAPPPPPPRYTDVTFLESKRKLAITEPLKAGTPYTVEIAVRSTRTGITRGRKDQLGILEPMQPDTVNVWVLLTDETYEGTPEQGRQAFLFEQRVGSLRLPPTGDSTTTALFTVTPKPDAFAQSRRGRIGVRLYYRLDLIDHLELEPLVTGAQPALHDGRPALDAVFMRVAEAPLAFTREGATRTVNISIVRRENDKYQFTFVAGHEDSPDIPALVASQSLPESELNDYAARFRNILLDAAFEASVDRVDLKIDERDEILQSLSLLGTEIVGRVFDFQKARGDMFEIGKIFRNVLLADASIIQVSLAENAQDFVLPWQILTLKSYLKRDDPVDAKNLWGYRFILEVKRCGDAADQRAQYQKTRSPIRITYGRWVQFKNEAQHRQSLEQLIRDATNQAELAKIADDRDVFIRTLDQGGGELVYVYAHGHAAAPGTPAGHQWQNRVKFRLESIERDIVAGKPGSQALRDMLALWSKTAPNGSASSIQLSNSEISIQELVNYGIDDVPIRLHDEPIVILNTCESAQLWSTVRESFIAFFLTRGARAVVGTEATMPIVVTDPFGVELLKSLLVKKRTIGEAVLDARLALLARNNPLGLSYCIYGAADAHVISPDDGGTS